MTLASFLPDPPDTPVDPGDDRALLALALHLAHEAAAIILEIRARGFQTERKADSSPVTEADRASERHILTNLRRHCPHIPAVGEEEVSAGIHVETHRTYWLVDPLDGTRDFSAGSDDFAVNIGLVRGKEAVLGCVALPAYGQIYGGGAGLEATRYDAAGAQPIRAVAPPREGLRILASRHHANEERLQSWLKGQRVASVESLGSAVKFMRIAEGRADFYPRFGPTMEWDTAAPQAVLEAAGGHLLDERGQPMRYGKKNWLNSHFYCTGVALATRGT